MRRCTQVYSSACNMLKDEHAQIHQRSSLNALIELPFVASCCQIEEMISNGNTNHAGNEQVEISFSTCYIVDEMCLKCFQTLDFSLTKCCPQGIEGSQEASFHTHLTVVFQLKRKFRLASQKSRSSISTPKFTILSAIEQAKFHFSRAIVS